MRNSNSLCFNIACLSIAAAVFIPTVQHIAYHYNRSRSLPFDYDLPVTQEEDQQK